MNLVEVKSRTESFGTVKTFRVDVDISIEAWYDITGQNNLDIKSEIAKVLGDELVEIIMENWRKT